jgi:hypothetical protein
VIYSDIVRYKSLVWFFPGIVILDLVILDSCVAFIVLRVLRVVCELFLAGTAWCCLVRACVLEVSR